MTSLQRSLLIGGLAGAIGSVVASASIARLGSVPGTALGFLVCAGTGGLGAWFIRQSFSRELSQRLLALVATRGEEGPQVAAATGCGRLDHQLALLSQALGRALRAEEDLSEIEHLARTLWRATDGSTSANENGASARGTILGLLGAVRETADRVVDDAHALDGVTEQVASGALDQSKTVTLTTNTVESLSDKIDQISHNAEAAAGAGQRTREEALRGLEQVRELIEGIDRLRAHVESNGRKVRRLGDRSVEIGTIVDLIDGISGRTDMLALNATIESVRAGEHGRGFAVVAEEIRKLAERTASATREIGTLVEAIQADTHESIAALTQEQAEVEQEAQRVREAGAALARISEVAEESAQLVEGISHSANDQVQATHELVQAVQHISEVTQQTLESAARAREFVRHLDQRCERLHRLSTVPAGRPSILTTNGIHSRLSLSSEQSI